MTLTELVNEVVNYSALKEVRTEMAARRRDLLHTYNNSSVLPAVAEFEKLAAVTPHAIDVLRAQGAQACKYEVVLAAKEADGGRQMPTYVVARMGSGARSIASAYGTALTAAIADGCTAQAAEAAAVGAAVAASATSASSGEAGGSSSGSDADTTEAAFNVFLKDMRAIDAGLPSDAPAAFRVVSLLHCSCQFSQHTG